MPEAARRGRYRVQASQQTDAADRGAALHRTAPNPSRRRLNAIIEPEEGMRWSKLKQRIEANFAPSLKGRVTVMVTRYRTDPDHEGRWAIMLDGREIGGLGCIVADYEQSALIHSIEQELGINGSEAQTLGDAALCAKGRHTLPMFSATLFEYLNMSIEAAIESSDAVVRSLAILDRRLGKRRLAALRLSPDATPLEQTCLEARLTADRVVVQRSDPTTTGIVA